MSFSSLCKGFVSVTTLAALGMGFSSAFDWPQDETNADSFRSYFAQLRGGRIESSIVFNESSSDVKAADSGELAIVIGGHTSDYGWFDSPLGNAVVIAHGDGISTVYGNLDDDSLPKSMSGSISAGSKIGESGNSAWHEGESGLEFQVLDTVNKGCINPRLLMPRIGKELELFIGSLSLDDRDGNTHYLLNERNLPSGTYRLYHDRQDVAVPYKTQVALNGLTVETVSYDNLIESKGSLCVQGNEKYSVRELYPDSKRRLLSVIHLAHGHSTLSVFVVDILGESHQIKYNIDID
ncbi:MAG: M23 family metallopeptidase [Treponema sp.]|nr:M23 family metallopeptidase [Treponema sp.]